MGCRKMNTGKKIKREFDEFSEILGKIDHQSVEKVVDFLSKRDYGIIYTCGNGGSASTAEHFACDLNKWSNYDQEKKIRSVCLNTNMPYLSALTNDDGWSMIYKEQLKLFLKKEDVLVCFSVHGGTGEQNAGPWSQNLVQAINYANKIGATTIGFSGCDGGVFKEKCKYTIIVPSESTPVVEGLHSVLTHLICDSIR